MLRHRAMLDDLRHYPHDSRFTCDVAIVGAGFALWTAFQREFRADGTRVAPRVHVMVRGEQAPNPASRVLLDGAHALGMSQTVLDWRDSGQD